jgi:UDP:flavonoid glycosyltransferase YjiC (YdhE family)
MVTNGGYNGVSIALANGVPLVVNGHVGDKPEVGKRVEWAGVGVNLKEQRPAPVQIRQAVRQMLDNPSYRQKARQMQYHFAHYNSGVQSAILLEQLALTQRPVTLAGKVEVAKVAPSWLRSSELAGAC